MHFPDEDIGGAIVRRPISLGPDLAWRPGRRLTRDEVLALPRANRNAMVNSERIAIFPRDVSARTPEPKAPERHIVHNGGGRFDVIAGIKLNERPLSKDEAEELATRSN